MSVELIIHPNPKGYGPYRAYLHGVLLCTVRQPLYDGARELLRLGYSADTVLTMRHEGSACRSFIPTTIGKAARLTVVENDTDGIRLDHYEPYPLKDERKREKMSARGIKSEPEGGARDGFFAILGSQAA